MWAKSIFHGKVNIDLKELFYKLKAIMPLKIRKLYI